MLYLANPQSEEQIVQHIQELIDKANELTLDAAAPESPPVEEHQTKALIIRIEQIFLTQIGISNAYYAPIHEALEDLKQSYQAKHLEDVCQYLQALGAEISSKRLVLLTTPVPDETAPKFFDMVQVTVTVYQGIAASIIGLIVAHDCFSRFHINSLFWGTIAAAVSFVLGVLVQMAILDSLARKRNLRESILGQKSICLMKLQIGLLLVSIGFIGYFAFNGGVFDKNRQSSKTVTEQKKGESHASGKVE